MRMGNGRARIGAGLAVSAMLLVPLAVFGGPALAKSSSSASEYEYSSHAQYGVTICHVTGSKKHPAHTITVSSAAVKAHLKHGDHLGACTGTETSRPKKHTAPVTAPTTTGGPGNSGSHGNGHHK